METVTKINLKELTPEDCITWHPPYSEIFVRDTLENSEHLQQVHNLLTSIVSVTAGGDQVIHNILNGSKEENFEQIKEIMLRFGVELLEKLSGNIKNDEIN